MSLKIKTKKMSIIAGAITIMLSSFSSFAVGPSVGSLPKQAIGASGGDSGLAEQKIGDFGNMSSGPANEENINNSISRKIELKKPGKYRLVGADSAGGSLTPKHPFEVVEIVNSNDRIVIGGNGAYNVIMDNVKIFAKPNNLGEVTPFSIMRNAEVKLTLKGDNVLNGDLSHGVALRSEANSTLTITKASEGARLHAWGSSVGISIEGKFSIEGGNIVVYGERYGIANDDMIVVEGGNIKSNGKIGIQGQNITINSGAIEATGDSCGIRVTHLKIKDGNVATQGGECGIFNASGIMVWGGNITAYGEEYGIENCRRLFIFGGNVRAIGVKQYGIVGREMRVKNGTVEVNGGEYGMSMGRFEIEGGNIVASGKKGGIKASDGGVFDITKIKNINVKKNGNYVVYDTKNMGTLEINTMDKPEDEE